jgi:glycosyltransferase involved in cell wall biosynthesis
MELSAFKNFATQSIQKAKNILTFSENSKHEIGKIISADASKIKLLPIGIPEIYQPLNWEEKESIKKKYSDGKEYFLFNGTLHPAQFLTLLKAFSIFKKKLKSNLQLVIADTSVHQNHHATGDLKNYKYRNEVILLHSLSEKDTAEIIAGAYSLIQPLQNEISLLAILNAVQCNTPSIVSDTVYFRDKLNTAALYFNPESFEELAEKMISIYIEEEKRKALIEKEKELSGHLQIDKTIAVLREAILQAAKQ